MSRTFGKVGRSGSRLLTGSPARGSTPTLPWLPALRWLPASAGRSFLAIELPQRPGDVTLDERVVARRGVVRLERMRRPFPAGVANRDGQVPAKPAHAGPLHRAPLQQRPQLVVRSRPQIEQARRVQPFAGLPGRIRRHTRRRLVVVRTDVLADVTAVRMRTDRCTVLVRNGSLGLNREI